ncbi:hypothetical protein BDW60DRAFT_186734 [Aspergillus nidulans var. acristatus]
MPLMLQEAVKATPENHTDCLLHLNTLEKQLICRYDKTGVMADLMRPFPNTICFTPANLFDYYSDMAGQTVLQHLATISTGRAMKLPESQLFA